MELYKALKVQYSIYFKNFEVKYFIYGILLLLFFLKAPALKAQNPDTSETGVIYKADKKIKTVNNTILNAFKNGLVRGHFRYFNMYTDNEKDLTDYYANALGGGLGFETAQFHKFQFAISGFYIFNIGSSDLTKLDPISGQPNRYEIGLFDIENSANKMDINRLEEFYLKYNFKKSSLILGRMLINTPFINLQDGRMRPTAVESLWAEFNELKHVKIEGGWIYSISPRSTTKWYSVGESMGIYPSGLSPNGSSSAYSGNVHSRGIAMVGIHASLSKNMKFQAWNMFTENMFNTAMLQADFTLDLNNYSKFLIAGQLIKQNAVNNGGNKDQTLTYFQKGSESLSFGAKIAWSNPVWETSLNYNRITAAGRYLLPREWGKDPFFVFLPRERTEGFGDVHAVMAKIDYKMPAFGLKTSLAAGYYGLPDVKNYNLNKYAMPAYTQINTDIRYTFTNSLKGLEAQLLLIAKLKSGETYGNSRMLINKVNMWQSNLVLNFHF